MFRLNYYCSSLEDDQNTLLKKKDTFKMCIDELYEQLTSYLYKFFKAPWISIPQLTNLL